MSTIHRSGLLGLAYPGAPLFVESREVPVATEPDSRADDTENSGDLRLVHTGQSYEVRTFAALYVCAHLGAICVRGVTQHWISWAATTRPTPVHPSLIVR